MPVSSALAAFGAVLLAVASPPLRTPTAQFSRPAVRPPGPQAAPTAPHTSNPPAATTAAPIPVGGAASASKVAEELSGADLLASPNVFRGLSASGQMLEHPAPLERNEELELVRRALFFISSTNAQRSLQEKAKRGEGEGEASAGAALDWNHHESILAEMRAEAESATAASKEARRSGKLSATETACEVPAAGELSETEFRLRLALGRAAYNRLFHHNQKLIYYEVNKLWGANWQKASVMEKADFLQEGAQGLLRAIRLFDTARGVRFSTYAAWHVRAFVLRALRDKSHLVRLPQTLQADMKEIRKARYRYAVENQGHVPSERVLAEMLSWPTARVDAAIKGLASASATSLDAETKAPVGSNYNGEPMMSRVASKRHDSQHAENELYVRQLKHTLLHAMAERDPRRIEITRLKYGLEDGHEWTYPQLAQRFNTTANVAKSIVRTEVNFLRRTKRRVLEEFLVAED